MMIVIILNNSKRGTFWVEGSFSDWDMAAKRARHIEKEHKDVDAYVMRLYRRNKYGAPTYPWFGDDTGD